MISVMLVAQNEKERQILTMALEQLGVKVIHSEANYSSFIKVSQYAPEIALVEIPRNNIEQTRFIALVRKNRSMWKSLVIGYGNKMPKADQKHIDVFVDHYLERPLKFAKIVELIKEKASKLDKEIKKEIVPDATGRKKDLVEILSGDTMAMRKIELIVKNISTLMAFPFTVAKVLRITEDSKTCADDLAKVINVDSTITTHVMRIANTVFYLNRQPIENVKEAIVRIGFVETKRITIVMTVMDVVNSKLRTLGFSRIGFWYYSLATAIIAVEIVNKTKFFSSEEAFLGGLLHSFGIILWDEFFPEIFQNILEKTTSRRASFVDTELDTLQISQFDIVRELFQDWKIPSLVIEGVCRYSKIPQYNECKSEEDQFALIIYLASMYAKIFLFGKSCDMYVHPIKKWMLDDVKMSGNSPRHFYYSVRQKLQMYKSYLNISTESENLFTITKPSAVYIGVYTPPSMPFFSMENTLTDCGFKVVRIMSLSKPEVYFEKLHLICFFSDKDIPSEEIERLTTIPSRYQIKNSDHKNMTSVLAMVENDSPLLDDTTESHFHVIKNEFDMREFSALMEDILSKEQGVTAFGDQA